MAATNGLLFGEKYPKEVLNRNWKRLLLNQFHDIIPGSSIKEVYEDSERDYEAVYKEIGGTKRAILEKIGDNVNRAGLLVYNPNSHIVSGYVKKRIILCMRKLFRPSDGK